MALDPETAPHLLSPHILLNVEGLTWVGQSQEQVGSCLPTFHLLSPPLSCKAMVLPWEDSLITCLRPMFQNIYSRRVQLPLCRTWQAVSYRPKRSRVSIAAPANNSPHSPASAHRTEVSTPVRLPQKEWDYHSPKLLLRAKKSLWEKQNSSSPTSAPEQLTELLLNGRQVLRTGSSVALLEGEWQFGTMSVGTPA